jgi:sugar O-acyltransferase (sialic acid O-acetyltransferase NeuD family)
MSTINSEKRIYIIGAGSVGGHIGTNPQLYGLEEVDIIYIDNDINKIGKFFHGKKIIGPVEYLLEIKEPINVVIGVALQSIKKRIFNKLSHMKNISFPSLIAKNAWVSPDTKIGVGVIVYPNTSINYGCTLDDFSILNMNCAVGHECHIGKFSSLAPGVNLGGNTIIGEFTEMGIGCVTKQLISIGDNVQVAGQAMVVNDLQSGVKVKGVPAKEY